MPFLPPNQQRQSTEGIESTHSPVERNVLQHKPPHPFNGPLSGTIRVSRYQKGKNNQDFTEATQNKHIKLKLGLVAFYDIWPGNGEDLFSKEKIRAEKTKKNVKKKGQVGKHMI